MFGVYKCPDKKPAIIDENPRHVCQERYIRAGVPGASYKYQKFVCQRYKTVKHYLGDEFAEKDSLKQLLIIKNQEHNDRRTFKRLIRDRVDIKMNDYEKEIDKRREKLNQILSKEEREYITEIIKQVQSFADQQFEEKRQKVIEAKARIEKERLDFVNEMKLKQYTAKCTELQPLLSYQRKLEADAAQKIQREEYKQRKEAEKELDCFWLGLQAKQDEAMKEVVVQKSLQRLKIQKENKFFLQRQIEEQKALEQRRKEEKQKEAEELERLKEKIRQEEQAEKEKKLQIKEKVAQELYEGVKQREQALKQQSEDELKITRAFEKISEEELRKEQEKIRNKTSTAARDMKLFEQYQKELAVQRREIEKERERINNEVMESIKRKYDEGIIKDAKARDDLFKSCITTNGIMIEENRKERARRKQNEENQEKFFAMTREQSDKLNAEAARQKKLAIAKYRADLDGQIRYAELQKQRQREAEKRMEKSAVEEEEKYGKIVAEVLGDVSKQSKIHPFKKVIIDEKCPCSKPLY